MNSDRALHEENRRAGSAVHSHQRARWRQRRGEIAPQPVVPGIPALLEYLEGVHADKVPEKLSLRAFQSSMCCGRTSIFAAMPARSHRVCFAPAIRCWLCPPGAIRGSSALFTYPTAHLLIGIRAAVDNFMSRRRDRYHQPRRYVSSRRWLFPMSRKRFTRMSVVWMNARPACLSPASGYFVKHTSPSGAGRGCAGSTTGSM